MKWALILSVPLVLETCTEKAGGDVSDVDNTPVVVSPSADEKHAQIMMDLVAASPAFSQIPQACPRDIYQTKTHRAGPVLDCAQTPRLCLSQCEGGDQDACFDAAREIERASLQAESEAKYPLFMEGCALGHGIACVNAGATAKNGDWLNAPPVDAALPDCQFQTYLTMCEDGTPWGCYMTAQEYDGYDGSQPGNQETYDRYMRQACVLDAESGACDAEYQ